MEQAPTSQIVSSFPSHNRNSTAAVMKPHLATDFGRTQSRQDTFEATSKALHKKVKNVQGQGGELAKTVSELKDIRMTNKSDLGVHRN